MTRGDWTFGGMWPYEPRWFQSADGRMHYIDEGPRGCRSVVISRLHQRQGYATEAARAMIDYAFRELHLRRMVATTTRDNAASIGVMRNVGMRIEENPYPDPPWFQVVGILDSGSWMPPVDARCPLLDSHGDAGEVAAYRMGRWSQPAGRLLLRQGGRQESGHREPRKTGGRDGSGPNEGLLEGTM